VYDVSHVLLSSGIIFTKFELGQPSGSWLITFYFWGVTSRCDLDLWPLDSNVCRVSTIMWLNSVPNFLAKSNILRRCDSNLNIETLEANPIFHNMGISIIVKWSNRKFVYLVVLQPYRACKQHWCGLRTDRPHSEICEWRNGSTGWPKNGTILVRLNFTKY